MNMDQLPATAYIGIGTIIAAFITAIIALFTSIMTKEIKISELRQLWINDLRNELSKLISLVNRLHILWDASENKSNEDRKKIINENVQTIQEIDELTHRLRMRLNPKEHKKLIAHILNLEKMACDINLLEKDSYRNTLYDKYTDESNDVLKAEWVRVKKGETSYRTLISVVKLIIVISLVLIISA